MGYVQQYFRRAQNQLGLTDIGKAAIKEMMRLGMIIDVDHMSDHSVRYADAGQ